MTATIKTKSVAKDFYRVDRDGSPVGFVQVNRNWDGKVESFLLCDIDEVAFKLEKNTALSLAAKMVAAHYENSIRESE